MPRVLIIDDAAFIRFSMRKMLEKNGYEVVGEAENGDVGFTKYQQLRPDIVTLDVTMPEVDGLTGLKLITEFDPAAKVVMVSAVGQTTIIKEAILNGAKYFLVKPFKEEQVIETLSKVLNR